MGSGGTKGCGAARFLCILGPESWPFHARYQRPGGSWVEGTYEVGKHNNTPGWLHICMASQLHVVPGLVSCRLQEISAAEAGPSWTEQYTALLANCMHGPGAKCGGFPACTVRATLHSTLFIPPYSPGIAGGLSVPRFCHACRGYPACLGGHQASLPKAQVLIGPAGRAGGQQGLGRQGGRASKDSVHSTEGMS